MKLNGTERGSGGNSKTGILLVPTRERQRHPATAASPTPEVGRTGGRYDGDAVRRSAALGTADHIPRARALGLLTRAGKSGRASWQLTPKAKAFQDWEGTTGLTPAHVEGDLDRWRDRWDARRAPY